MKGKNKYYKKFFIIIALILAFVSCLSLISLGADSTFEKSISDFPESYKPYLRTLHDKYPNWNFVPFVTNIDWNEAVNNESGDKSLVVGSTAYSNTFKSMEVGDYNKSTGSYIQKDSGFVTANKLCVSYYMDPRNFLNENGIFQFELLSFNSTFTVSAVETVLKGSFMADAYMNYYDSNGKYVTSTVKYSIAIYNAGKKYNINPCYLASKIRNEIGTSSSNSSISGKYTGYLGIYNFYNIGATDGTGAIARGLQWASTGTTYSRPWTSPAKSIAGGAEFLAEKYISKGQFTGYLQRFNVNPDSANSLYTHQYMTNISGALSQGYSTYLSYVKSSMLLNAYTFSIPVYKNMDTDTTADSSLNLADSQNQYGYISAISCNVRTGPSTSNAKLSVTLSNGDYVKISGIYLTDSDYYLDVLQYTFWYKIQFTKNNVTYNGYVPESFLTLSTVSDIALGTYSLNMLTSSKAVGYNLISSDSSIAKINSDKTVTFLKAGKVYITAYDSRGHYDKVQFKAVGTTAESNKLSGFKATVSGTSITASCTKLSAAKYYDFHLIDCDTGALVKRGVVTTNAYTFTSLTAGKAYKIIGRTLTNSSTSAREFGQFSDSVNAIITPDKIASLTFSVDSNDNVKLAWSKVSLCTGYYIYMYDSASSGYLRIGKTSPSVNTFVIPDEYKNTEHIYRVRAYTYFNSVTTYGSASNTVTAMLVLPKPTGVSQSSVTTSSLTLNWSAVSSATGYIISKYNPTTKTYDKVATTTALKYSVSGLSAGQTDIYGISAYSGSGASMINGTQAIFYSSSLPGNTTGLTFSDVTSSSYTLKWTKATGAAYYKIYKLNATSGKYEPLTTVENNSINITKLSQDTVSNYKVSAAVKTKSVEVEGKSSSDISVRTNLKAVTGFSATNITPNSYTLLWDKNTRAEKYEIYLYNKTTGVYSLFASTTGTSYAIKNLQPVTSARYKVRCSKTEGTSEIDSDFSTELIVSTSLPTVTNLKLTAVSSTGFTFTWDKNQYANVYYVYQRQSDASYKKVASVKTNSYTISGLSESFYAYYRIKAVNNEGEEERISAYSDPIKAVTTPAKVSGIKTSSVNTTYATLTWTKIANATSYRVYIYNQDKKKYELAYDVSTNSCKLTGLKTGTTVYVKVRAYASSTAKYYGSYSQTFVFSTLPGNIGSVSSSAVTTSSYTISWSKADKATSYRIYKYNSTEKKYKYLAQTTKCTYSFKSLSSGSGAIYRIYPVLTDSTGKAVIGKASAALYVSTLPAKVTGVKCSAATSTAITLQWTKTTGSTFYQVYLYNPTTKKYELKGTATTSSFKASSLKSSTKYYFRVRAVKTLNGKNYSGSTSETLSAKTK